MCCCSLFAGSLPPLLLLLLLLLARSPARLLSPSTRDRWRLRCSYLDCLGEEEQRNHDLALNGIFLETIDAVASTANAAVYAVQIDSFH